MDEIIFELYVNQKFTLRMVAREIGKDHHFVKRRLEKMGVTPSTHDRIKKVLSPEHKRKISLSWEKRKENGYEPYNKGKKTDRVALLKNMRNHLHYDVSFEWLDSFEDIEKLKFLNRAISRNRDCCVFDTDMYKEYINKFYYDDKFNSLYERWIATNDEWIRPSLDHIVPRAKGGDLGVSNLRFISWIENRAKGDMYLEEWENIKNNFEYYF